MYYPETFEQKISFNIIRQLLKDRCLCPLGEEMVDRMKYTADYNEVLQSLSQTDETLRLITISNEELPVGDFFDIREALQRVQVVGLYLDETEIFNLKRALEAVRRLVLFINRQDTELFPELHKLTAGINSFEAITKRIDAILDKFGKVKDNASPELNRIRRDIFKVQSSISKTLQNILRQAQTDGYVDKDVSPTMREGRLVIPVSPAFKRKVSGIIHDESATGKTVYIEPAQVVEANNRVRELESEERREVMRILVEFTDFLRPYTDEIMASQHFLGIIDFLRAKSLFAIEIKAIKPRVDNTRQLEWNKAIHPLLYLTLKKQQKTVVPLDITLNEKQRILIISGPNAGGKSVCLKTVALLQYMLQCGMLIPLHENSRTGIFERLFIDIGDEQSIENDLSTYSSHLLNMKFFIKNSNQNTLLLIDEFGSGTEPQIGGAIAEASLERFNRNGAYGVITTHYTNLKHYAEDTEGIVNGAMLYDRQHLQPLFQLQIGNPGSSFAVEIARKIGLPEDLIADAAQKVGLEHLDYDKHLQDIVRDKRYWERKRMEIRQKEKRLDETLEKYETELGLTEKKRKEITTQAKQEAENLLKEANAKIENTIRTIKESMADKEKTRNVRTELEKFKEKVTDKKVQEHKPKTKLPFKKNAEKIIDEKEVILHPGSAVRLKGQTATGTIIELNDKHAVVAFGQLKSTVKISNLEAVSNNQMKKEKRLSDGLGTAVTDEVRQRKLTFKSEIDVRGMRGDEALQAVTYFIDDAVMVGVASVRILHGTGTGALRQLIRQYLNTVHGVLRFHDEHVQFGGAGITVVEFE
ncbi:MAG TPA: Smr/MutS family protein [Paludibacteraceae bacterium]|nr:Smr/MutS family protein [Paludibacteraceae bacterium]